MQVYPIESVTAIEDYHGCGRAAGIVSPDGEVLRLVYEGDHADAFRAMGAVATLLNEHPGSRAVHGMASCYELCV